MNSKGARGITSPTREQKRRPDLIGRGKNCPADHSFRCQKALKGLFLAVILSGSFWSQHELQAINILPWVRKCVFYQTMSMTLKQFLCEGVCVCMLVPTRPCASGLSKECWIRIIKAYSKTSAQTVMFHMCNSFSSHQLVPQLISPYPYLSLSLSLSNDSRKKYCHESWPTAFPLFSCASAALMSWRSYFSQSLWNGNLLLFCWDDSDTLWCNISWTKSHSVS